MGSAVGVDRLHFAFTITFHYIFPQLTMGLALLLLILKTVALRTRNESYNRAVRFWARIFAINFALGVVTGIPMEFQFGTNWAAFSRSAGGVIGQTLAMEGVFSCGSAPGFPVISSSPPTPGCSTRWPIRRDPAAISRSPAFGICC